MHPEKILRVCSCAGCLLSEVLTTTCSDLELGTTSADTTSNLLADYLRIRGKGADEFLSTNFVSKSVIVTDLMPYCSWANR